MKMEFSKMHGCGNDYVYVNCMKKELPNPNAISEYVVIVMGLVQMVLICIMLLLQWLISRMRMFNADAF